MKPVSLLGLLAVMAGLLMKRSRPFAGGVILGLGLGWTAFVAAIWLGL